MESHLPHECFLCCYAWAHCQLCTAGALPAGTARHTFVPGPFSLGRWDACPSCIHDAATCFPAMHCNKFSAHQMQKDPPPPPPPTHTYTHPLEQRLLSHLPFKSPYSHLFLVSQSNDIFFVDETSYQPALATVTSPLLGLQPMTSDCDPGVVCCGCTWPCLMEMTDQSCAGPWRPDSPEDERGCGEKPSLLSLSASFFSGFWSSLSGTAEGRESYCLVAVIL